MILFMYLFFNYKSITIITFSVIMCLTCKHYINQLLYLCIYCLVLKVSSYCQVRLVNQFRMLNNVFGQLRLMDKVRFGRVSSSCQIMLGLVFCRGDVLSPQTLSPSASKINIKKILSKIDLYCESNLTITKKYLKYNCKNKLAF